MAAAVAVLGIFGAMFAPLNDITDFLYLIGSVFAPMAAIQIADHYILKKDSGSGSVCLHNLIIWLIGFILYRQLMGMDIVVGSTLPDMVITILVCVGADKVRKSIVKKKRS